MSTRKQLTYCDGIVIGRIATDEFGMFYGTDIEGNTVAKPRYGRVAVYRELRRIAYEAGKLVRVRKGVYRAADNQKTEA